MNSNSNTMTGASAFLSILKDEGVTHLFGNPGTTELPIMDALSEHVDLTYVLGLQEAIVVAMADGYARASGQLAACNVHVAPGLGNAMGSLYNAKWFGSPVLLTAGQQEQGHGLTEPLLYAPLVPIATPLVKWATEVTRLEDVPRTMRRAAKVALTPPTGPVFISLPGDVLNAEDALDLGGRTRVETATRPSDDLLQRLAARVLAAERPVIISGHEVATRDALAQAAQLAELLGAPVYQQTMPYGAHFLSEHPNFMGALTRDQRQVREALSPYDLLICLGTDVLRMSVWRPVEPLPDGMPIVQIGLRDWEMGKNYPTELAIRSDVKETLKALCPIVGKLRGADRATAAKNASETLKAHNWSSQRDKFRHETLEREGVKRIGPDLLVVHLVEGLPDDAIVVDEGLVSAWSLLKVLAFRDAQRYYGLASGGIGFAIAGAIGIHLAHPTRPLLAVIGDGSAMYSIQALWTAAHLRLPITYLIANNKSYRILKERLLGFHNNEHFIGMDLREPEIDFVGLAQSMGVPAHRIVEADHIVPSLQEAFATDGPTLLDVSVEDGFN